MVPIDAIRRLLDAPGPFVSVYLATPSDQVDAPDQLRVRWQDARRHLEEEGAPPAALEAVERAVAEGHEGGDTLAVLASATGSSIVERLPEPPTTDVARVSELPYVAPLLEWAQLSVPHVVVIADREGADFVAIADDERVGGAEIDGDTEHIHRGKPGGWSQRRFQQRAENTWEQNAAAVAEEVAAAAKEIDARLVVASGDVRAVGFLRDHLPGDVAGRLRTVDGWSRGDEASLDDLADEVVRLVANVTAEDTVAVLREFAEERGQRDRAADGPGATLAALSEAKVGTLLVHDDPDDPREAWFGSDPVPVAPSREGLSALGVAKPRPGRLIDVAVRAALGTGAGVRVIPAHGPDTPTDGVGAILRY